jgi:hypothetical protein
MRSAVSSTDVYTAPANCFGHSTARWLDASSALTITAPAVTEWNDNINRILAMLTIHFSIERRNIIDNQIGAQFRAIGRSLEQAIRTDSTPDTNGIGDQLDELAGRVYNFNLDLLNDIRNRLKTLNEGS